MRHRTARQIIVCLLGLLLSVGMGLSAVQANTMTVEYALDGAGDNPDGGDCAGCGEEAASSSACYSVCASSVFSIAVSTASLSRVKSRILFVLGARSLRGAHTFPDPHPPRPAFST